MKFHVHIFLVVFISHILNRPAGTRLISNLCTRYFDFAFLTKHDNSDPLVYEFSQTPSFTFCAPNISHFFSNFPEMFPELVTRPHIELQIWEKLNLESKKRLSDALHPECPKPTCLKHRCPLNPIEKILSQSSREKPPIHCPNCQLQLLNKEYGGPCPSEFERNNPLKYFNRQPKKEPLLWADDQNNGQIR